MLASRPREIGVRGLRGRTGDGASGACTRVEGGRSKSVGQRGNTKLRGMGAAKAKGVVWSRWVSQDVPLGLGWGRYQVVGAAAGNERRRSKVVGRCLNALGLGPGSCRLIFGSGSGRIGLGQRDAQAWLEN